MPDYAAGFRGMKAMCFTCGYEVPVQQAGDYVGLCEIFNEIAFWTMAYNFGVVVPYADGAWCPPRGRLRPEMVTSYGDQARQSMAQLARPADPVLPALTMTDGCPP